MPKKFSMLMYVFLRFTISVFQPKKLYLFSVYRLVNPVRVTVSGGLKLLLAWLIFFCKKADESDEQTRKFADLSRPRVAATTLVTAVEY